MVDVVWIMRQLLENGFPDVVRLHLTGTSGHSPDMPDLYPGETFRDRLRNPG